MPELSKSRRVLIFDYPGVGESEGSGVPFSTADLADTLAGLLAALELPRADVLGAFMGGMVAQELALRHAERVRRLVLVGTWARADAKRRLLLEQWRELARGDAPAAREAWEAARSVAEGEFLTRIHPFARHTTPVNTVAHAPIPLHPGAARMAEEFAGQQIRAT